MKSSYFIGVLVLAFSVTVSASPKQAWVAKDVALRQMPQFNATTISKLKKGLPVTVLQRKRAWYQVKSPMGTGWVKMLSLRFSNARSQNSMGVSGAWKSVTSSGTKTTVATGVRGFDEEDLKRSVPNLKAVETLDRYKISPAQAQTFADLGKLRTNNVQVR